jgi:hypothetical protein
VAGCRFDLDPSWSESGDRYLLKLFRDYVFHQVDESGAPVVNLAHVISCLNKVRPCARTHARTNRSTALTSGWAEGAHTHTCTHTYTHAYTHTLSLSHTHIICIS